MGQTGVLYLDHCPVQGRQRAELLLERVPIDTEKKGSKVINMAAERGLHSIVTQTCKVLGMRALLIDCIPFLTAETVLFSSEQTYELLQCLQELATDSSLPNKQQLLLEEHEQRLRLGLAKNLALALTVEGDSAQA